MYLQNNKIGKYSFLQLVKRMLTYTQKFRWLMTAYLVIAALNTLITLTFGYIINESVGSVIDNKSSVLSALILQTVVIVTAGVFLKYLGTYLFGTFRSCVMSEVREHAVGHIQKLPLSFMDHFHSGDLISRFSNDLDTVQKFIGDRLFQLMIDFIAVVLTAVYLASINLKLFVVSLSIMPPILVLSTFVSRPMGKYFKEASAAVGRANALAADSYGGLPIIKAYGLEGLFLSRFEEFVKTSIKFNSKGLHRLKFMPIFNILLWSTPFTICLIYGAILSMNGEISPGQIPAFVYLLNNIVWPVAAIPRIVADFQQSTGTARRFFEIMDTKPEREDGMDFGAPDSEECIRFCDVTFSYEKGKLSDGANVVKERGNPVLNGLSFSVRKGCKVALVGASGCGKSTVLKLIVGFYENELGTIDLFGHDLRKWSLHALREKISYVSQDTFLYPASIRDNIAMGRLNASEEEIHQAASAANALDFILELPEGMDTMVGERGIMLSGGQRQRLALARAFLQNSSIILLDEPTSALDTISEAQVQEALNRILEGRTVIIVTHRFSTIKDVDEILVMEQGRITERGTHQQLMNNVGLYTQLYNRQLERQDAV